MVTPRRFRKVIRIGVLFVLRAVCQVVCFVFEYVIERLIRLPQLRIYVRGVICVTS